MGHKRRKISTDNGDSDDADADAMPFVVTLKKPLKIQSPRKSIDSAPDPWALQISPFDAGLDVRYKVDIDGNSTAWSKMQLYHALRPGSNVMIRGVEADDDGGANPDDEVDCQYWYGHICEIRAASQMCVYVRILWLYRPEDLPSGRLAHHSDYELVPSNHVEIISAVAVSDKIEVGRFDARDAEQEDAYLARPDPLPADRRMFWRQTYDILEKGPKSLSALEKRCACKQPLRVSQMVACGGCGRWQHTGCLVKSVMKLVAAHKAELVPEPELKAEAEAKAESEHKPELTKLLLLEPPVTSPSFSERVLRSLTSPFRSSSKSSGKDAAAQQDAKPTKSPDFASLSVGENDDVVPAMGNEATAGGAEPKIEAEAKIEAENETDDASNAEGGVSLAVDEPSQAEYHDAKMQPGRPPSPPPTPTGGSEKPNGICYAAAPAPTPKELRGAAGAWDGGVVVTLKGGARYRAHACCLYAGCGAEIGAGTGQAFDGAGAESAGTESAGAESASPSLGPAAAGTQE